jgi:peroxiredoxin family protein
MTDLLEHPQPSAPSPQTIEKVSVIISKGSLEGIYPGLIMANGARMEGIDANLFFTFFDPDAINNAKHEHVEVATVGNPGLHLATWAGGFPGVSALVTHKFATEMEKLDIPPIPEFIEMISGLRRRALRLQGIGRPVRPHQGRLHPPSARHHHRRRVLRAGRRRPDHLYLAVSKGV